MKRYQRGDAGVGMVVVMVIMLAGFLWWGGGMHGGGHAGGGQQPAARMEKAPLDLLDEAYARGEITREEYLQRRADLQKR